RLEDQTYSVAAALLRLQSHVRHEMTTFPGSRPATREELYRRLHLARDYMTSCYAEPLTTPRLARLSRLCPHHFHLTFQLALPPHGQAGVPTHAHGVPPGRAAGSSPADAHAYRPGDHRDLPGGRLRESRYFQLALPPTLRSISAPVSRRASNGLPQFRSLEEV